MILQLEVKAHRNHRRVCYFADLHPVLMPSHLAHQFTNALHVMYRTVAKYEKKHPLTFREEKWESIMTVDNGSGCLETETIRLKTPKDLYRHTLQQ